MIDWKAGKKLKIFCGRESIDSPAIITGFLVSLVLGVVFSFIIPVVGGMVSSLLAGILVGYMVNINLGNGAVNGAIMGLLGGLIESIAILIIGTAFAGIIGLIAAGLGVIVVLALTLIHIVIAAFGGVIGSAIRE